MGMHQDSCPGCWHPFELQASSSALIMVYHPLLLPWLCPQVEPPQPEEKLAMLSDIAQEAGVEWDLSAAARELLPPGMMSAGKPAVVTGGCRQLCA